jgi:hypothetical protein
MDVWGTSDDSEDVPANEDAMFQHETALLEGDQRFSLDDPTVETVPRRRTTSSSSSAASSNSTHHPSVSSAFKLMRYSEHERPRVQSAIAEIKNLR